MLNIIKNLFRRRVSAISFPIVSAWKRGTFAENMEKISGARGWNSSGTFCRYCGDWIVDSAYYSEHSGHHKPLRGSWNYENPDRKRRDPDDIKPDHAQWLVDIREWAERQQNSIYLHSTFAGIGQEPMQFHSQEEANAVLNPFNLQLSYSEKAIGTKRDGEDWHYHGGWSVHTKVIKK